MEEIFLFEEKPRSFKERVEFSGNISREDFSITIHNTSLSDSGYYTCHVSNHNNMKANTTTVLLEIFPSEYIFQQSIDLYYFIIHFITIF
uniref:Immunoglobulin V-set domain-containing protein n=1 Tax=Eptatretus burgeri TaxID=7764 RepID=A0A8C4R8M7_EPTBU